MWNDGDWSVHHMHTMWLQQTAHCTSVHGWRSGKLRNVDVENNCLCSACNFICWQACFSDSHFCIVTTPGLTTKSALHPHLEKIGFDTWIGSSVVRFVDAHFWFITPSTNLCVQHYSLSYPSYPVADNSGFFHHAPNKMLTQIGMSVLYGIFKENVRTV